ncbi:MAG: hypothetical protein RMJ88_10220, partial [Thermogemmata sp.]|nr:hypothetical protein [Thermogemmata sp.]
FAACIDQLLLQTNAQAQAVTPGGPQNGDHKPAQVAARAGQTATHQPRSRPPLDTTCSGRPKKVIPL